MRKKFYNKEKTPAIDERRSERISKLIGSRLRKQILLMLFKRAKNH
jgi:hypothetical protein